MTGKTNIVRLKPAAPEPRPEPTVAEMSEMARALAAFEATKPQTAPVVASLETMRGKKPPLALRRADEGDPPPVPPKKLRTS